MTSSALNLNLGMPELPAFGAAGGLAGMNQWLPGSPAPTGFAGMPSFLNPTPAIGAGYDTSLGFTPGLTQFGADYAAPGSMDVLGWLGDKFNRFDRWAQDSGMVGKRLANGDRVDGWGGLAVGAASSLLNGWMGMQNLKVAKQQLAFQKDAFNKNYSMQTRTLNTNMEDRQRARVSADPTNYESVDSYMKKNRVG